MKKLIIFGAGETADIAHEYFSQDSDYEVAAFAVEARYKSAESYNGLPLISFEEMKASWAPSDYEAFVAISYVKLNRVRARCYRMVKAAGYRCASYVSSRAFVWRTAKLGENAFVFENNVIQHGVELGDCVTLWSGNHIGHQTKIRDYVYIASHAVISGFCEIGEYSFVGVNATFNDHIKLGTNNIVGSGALVVRNSEPERLLVGTPAKAAAKSSFEAFNVTPADLD